MAEWPKWTPTAEIHKRIEGLPASVPAASTTRSAPARSISTRAIATPVPHPWHQPAGIYRRSISSGCIRMTNEDVIDLYSRVKTGTMVVVLEPSTATRRSIRRWPCRAAAVTPRCSKPRAKEIEKAPVRRRFFCCRQLAARPQVRRGSGPSGTVTQSWAQSLRQK